MGRRSNGEGTIYKRKDGYRCAQYTQLINGKEKRKTVYGKTQKEVKNKLNILKVEKTSDVQENSMIPLGTWMAQWLEEYKKPMLKITTYEGYWMMFRSHIEKSNIASRSINKLTTTELQVFYNTLSTSGRSDGKGGLSPRMVRYIYILINGAMEQAIKKRFNNKKCK